MMRLDDWFKNSLNQSLPALNWRSLRATRRRRMAMAASAESLECRCLLSAMLGSEIPSATGEVTSADSTEPVPSSDPSPLTLDQVFGYSSSSIGVDPTTGDPLPLFVRFEGLSGSSTDATHVGWQESLAFDWEAFRGTSSFSNWADLHLVSRLDKLSPTLFLKVMARQVITRVDLELTHAANTSEDVLRLRFENVSMTSYRLGQDAAGEPIVEYTLSFKKLTFTYLTYNSDGQPTGTVNASYDQTQVRTSPLPSDSSDSTSSSTLPAPATLPAAAIPVGVDPTAGDPLPLFVRFDGLAGESTDPTHTGWQESLAFDWEALRGTASTSNWGDLHLVSRLDKLSPSLFLKVMSRQVIPTADLVLTRPGNTSADLLRLQFETVTITSYRVGQDAAGEPVVEYTLSFNKITFTYIPYDSAGQGQTAVSSSWNRTNNAPSAPLPSETTETTASNLPAAAIPVGVDPTAGDPLPLFVHFDGLSGESTDPTHVGWQESLAFDWEALRGTSNNSNWGDLHLVSRLDKLSPALFQKVMSRQVIPFADLELTRPGNTGADVLRLRFETVTITSYRLGQDAAGEPVVEYTLSFNKIRFTYLSYDSSGQSTGSFQAIWDRTQNAASALTTGASDPSASTLPAASIPIGVDPTSGNPLPLFVNFNGLTGESTDSTHVGWQEALSFDWEALRGTSTYSDWGDLHLVSRLDKLSPALFLKVMTQQHISQVDLELTHSGNTSEDVLRLKLEDVTISTYRLGQDAAGEPIVEYTLSFNKLTFTYIPYDSAGQAQTAVSGSWDRSLHTTVSPLPGGTTSSTSSATLPASAIPVGVDPTSGNPLPLFVRFDGMTGSSTDDSHVGWQQALAFDWEAMGGTISSYSDWADLHLVSRLDKLSPALFLKVMSQQVIPRVDLELTRPGNTADDVLQLRLDNVKITSYKLGQDATGEPVVEYTLSFTKITFTYTPYDSSGQAHSSLLASWDKSLVRTAALPSGTTDSTTAATLPAASIPVGVDPTSGDPLPLFVKFDGLTGSSTDPSHVGWQEALAFDWEAFRGTSTNSDWADLHLVSRLDRLSPPLFLRVMTRQVIARVDLELTRPGNTSEDVLQLRLDNVSITSYRLGQDAAGEPIVEYTLSFSKITFTFTDIQLIASSQNYTAPEDGSLDGTVSATQAPPQNIASSWDRSTNSSAALPVGSAVAPTMTYEVVRNPAHGTVELDPLTGQFHYVPAPDFDGTDNFTFRALLGSLISNSGQITIQILPENDAPLLNPNGTPLLDPITLNSPESSIPGTLVSDIIARMAPNGGITDPDTGALQGIAINGVSNTYGSWQYTINGGTNWTPIAVTGNSNALLLAADPNTRVRFIPNTNFIGQSIFAFVAWDRTGGVNGGTANVAIRGGHTPYSTAYEIATINVINSAPVLNNSGAPTLNTIPMNVYGVDNLGTLVSDIIARMGSSGGITDPNPGALQGIAINGLGNTATGDWQYSTNGGATWSLIGTTGNANARLLAADANTRIRYVPQVGYQGTAIFSFVAWDRTSGGNGAVVGAGTRGGTTPFSTDFEYATISIVNSAPELNDAGNPLLDGILPNVPDASNPGTLVSDLILRMYPAGGITDANPYALRGIAVIAKSGTGTWEFSTNNGTSWSAINSTSAANATLLSSDANTRVRYLPAAGFVGEAKIAFAAWDQSTGTNGSVANASTRGGSTAFSSAFEYASIFVNTAPTLNNAGTPALDSISNTLPVGSNAGILVSTLISRMGPSGGITDPDPAALKGLAIIGQSGSATGSWQYSTNGGTSWTNITATGSLNALLLASDSSTRIRYVPNAGFTGTVAIAFAAWDRSQWLNGSTVNAGARGGTTPFSLDYETATITITA